MRKRSLKMPIPKDPVGGCAATPKRNTGWSDAYSHYSLSKRLYAECEHCGQTITSEYHDTGTMSEWQHIKKIR